MSFSISIVTNCSNSGTFQLFKTTVKTREIIRLVASVCLSPDALLVLCVFVSNQETFAIKSCAQRSGAFNVARSLNFDV